MFNGVSLLADKIFQLPEACVHGGMTIYIHIPKKQFYPLYTGRCVIVYHVKKIFECYCSRLFVTKAKQTNLFQFEDVLDKELLEIFICIIDTKLFKTAN